MSKSQNLDAAEDHPRTSAADLSTDNKNHYNSTGSPTQSGLPRIGTLNRVFKSHESIAHDLSGKLKERRSAASYDYLAGAGDEQRVGDAAGKFSYHTGKQPSGNKSFDYLDEDQNREPRGPVMHTSSAANAGNCFDSDSDDEEAFLDHQIRMIEAKQAAALGRKSANAGPVGLLGFGMTTILLNLHNTGVFKLYSVIPAMGICFGGGAQLIAGLLEWTRGNTFAFVAFTSYGAFWLSLVCIWMLPNASSGGSPLVSAASEYFIGVYLALWGIFSSVMLICTLRMNVAIFLVFLTVTLLFLLLAGGCMADNKTAMTAAGYEGVVCGCLALYLGVAEVVNEVWDQALLPVIPMTQVLGWLGAKTGSATPETVASAKKER